MGVPGVGKTTVLKRLKEKTSEWKIITFGDLVFDVFEKEFGIKDRDKIRFSSIEMQTMAQEKAFKKLKKIADKKTILDTHPSIMTGKGYLPGLPFKYLKELDVDLLILLSATPEEIFARRVFDLSRKRIADLNVIKEHLMLNISFVSSYAAYKGIPAAIIHNKSGELDKTVEKILEIIKKR